MKTTRFLFALLVISNAIYPMEQNEIESNEQSEISLVTPKLLSSDLHFIAYTLLSDANLARYAYGVELDHEEIDEKVNQAYVAKASLATSKYFQSDETYMIQKNGQNIGTTLFYTLPRNFIEAYDLDIAQAALLYVYIQSTEWGNGCENEVIKRMISEIFVRHYESVCMIVTIEDGYTNAFIQNAEFELIQEIIDETKPLTINLYQKNL